MLVTYHRCLGAFIGVFIGLTEGSQTAEAKQGSVNSSRGLGRGRREWQGGWNRGMGGSPDYGAAATQCQPSVATGGNGTRAGGSSAFSRGRIIPGCYFDCPDFGMILQAKQNTSVGCTETKRVSLFATPG